jgi:choline dehydrogenase-like flavoprotein
MQMIPAEHRNGNARVFEEGFAKNGFKCAPLRRAQRDCRYGEGNDCIECLAGCPIQSKQSMPWTTLARARATGQLRLLSRFEVRHVEEKPDTVRVRGRTDGGVEREFTGRRLVLASGAIGNSKLLMQSGWESKLRSVGTGFYTHPQYMNLALYDREIHAEKGPFQAWKSDDPTFRKQGFKLENVFAPPVSIAMLVPGIGREFLSVMGQITRMACIEVAVRDTEPGRIKLTGGTSPSAKVIKGLNAEDRRRRDAGLAAVDAIFRSTGARQVIPGNIGIGLHLMGGCALGKDPATSVVGPDFRLHGSKRVFASDSSVFPDAPGINPSLTIMALSIRASQEVVS